MFISLFFVAFDNFAFFHNVIKVYGVDIKYILSLALLLWGVILFLLNLISFRWSIKPILILLLIVSSFVAYFMDTYNIVVDDGMIRNALQTDIHESSDLFSWKLVLYVIFLGIIPSFFVYKVGIIKQSIKKFIFSKVLIVLLFGAILGLNASIFGSFYASFFREHKPLRYYTNPTYWIYSVGYYINKTYFNKPLKFKQIGLDAKEIKTDNKRKIVIMVVGEAARWDHFSLNGYKRETNPLLKNDNVISFANTYSCGTSTAHSVPCMFSIYDRVNYSHKKARATENVIDVLKHTKQIALLWRDNNSDSKGVALRIKHVNYKTPKNNPKCDIECRDEGMLVGLDKFIEKNRDKDIFIVLHQMGNHGPEYYKRYTKKFEKFKPVCKTNQLEQCTKAEITNAYDNAIVYTDYFLDKTIKFLQKYKDSKSALIYMSDHGESLGEKGVYLHGMPYFIAPEAQKHIGAIAWFNDNFKKEIDYNKIKQNANKQYSQDNLFSTILGLFNIKTSVYDKNKDIFK